MKNIHVLPTHKPSRLVKRNLGLIRVADNFTKSDLDFILAEFVNIYITSDEKIKDIRPYKGKWQLEQGQILNKFPSYLTDLSECKLVIMTTDQDLIKDGVQAIDDEFIEWFVKNPSCEYVETVFNNRGVTGAEKILKTFGEYKITIPKEEPKQETLEEVAQKILRKNGVSDSEMILSDTFMKVLNSMVDMGKWMQERSYSEEEVILLLQKYRYDLSSNKTSNLGDTTEKWLEKNK